jgi:hypothetical protein
VPAPVTVNVLPATEHGPEDTLKVTPRLELAVALREIGDTP